MRVTGDWLTHPGTQTLCAALESAGYRALFVGGCVRNALLGAAVADVDISTDATPQTVTNLAQSVGFKVVPTGIDHGTVTVIAQGRPHEVTTFRRDVETDGRHAVVAFATDVAEDAMRRDFTMNALYADARGQVIDPLGGLPDLLARRLRFVGDAETRIREDYLRILRFFRFHAWYADPDGGMDAEGLAACAALSAGIETLSAERVGAEVKKLLSAPDPAPAVASMAQAGILAIVLPGADARALAPLVHLEDGATPRPLRRLAVLGGDAGRLRLSRAEARDLAALREAIGDMAPPAVLGWRLGSELAADAMLARSAMLETPLPQGWQDDIARGAAAQFPIRAADLPDLSGPALGAELKRLQALWLSADLRLSREQLLR
ncbi:MAG: CCA tRNA nucleotidyltransferase [Rhodobacteraceae bacterium PARR1]|nr:MAG: CCA tRNA nucleotidyltransferase [Rhodobacteraceae bacterium PARR1]